MCTPDPPRRCGLRSVSGEGPLDAHEVAPLSLHDGREVCVAMALLPDPLAAESGRGRGSLGPVEAPPCLGSREAAGPRGCCRLALLVHSRGADTEPEDLLPDSTTH